jgi:hypothetical protein
VHTDPEGDGKGSGGRGGPSDLTFVCHGAVCLHYDRSLSLLVDDSPM